ncbi:hypothetical protein D9M71_565340 [compost metagenome]
MVAARSGGGHSLAAPEQSRPGVVARPARRHRLLGCLVVAGDAAQRHDLDRVLGQAVRRRLERVSGGDVGQRAPIRYRSAKPQQCDSPDRAVGGGEYPDAAVRRACRTCGPSHAVRRPGGTAGKRAAGRGNRYLKWGRAGLQHYLADHGRGRVHHRGVRRRPAQRCHPACRSIHRQGPGRRALAGLQQRRPSYRAWRNAA